MQQQVSEKWAPLRSSHSIPVSAMQCIVPTPVFHGLVGENGYYNVIVQSHAAPFFSVVFFYSLWWHVVHKNINCRRTDVSKLDAVRWAPP